MNNKSIVKAAMALVAVFASVTAVANHKDGHTSEGVGQIDTAQYNCNGLGATECMLMKLDRIERKIGCPLEDYLDDSCPYSPVDTTATFCISQGREGGIGAGWSVIPYMEGELGVGWPSVGWGKLTAKVENPLFLGPFPIPTELTIAGSASLGRNLNICIDVPLLAADHIAGGETISDEEMIDRIVRNINTPAFDGPMSRSKFQRRLSRLANYAIARVPGTNRFEFSTQQAHMTGLARVMDDDGESEFDALENAIDQLMSGDWKIPKDGGPLAILKSPMVDELRMVLEVPDPVQQVIDDPDMVLGLVFSAASGNSSPTAAGLAGFQALPAPAAVCDAFGFNSEIRTRFPGVDQFCGLFSQLPSFDQVTGIFGIVDLIMARVNSLPMLSAIRTEIEDLGCEIAGWSCDS